MITPGKILRYFNIDLCANAKLYSEILDKFHDEILDTLLDEPNAKESFSGHTGFVIALENDTREDKEIILSLEKRLRKYTGR